VLFVSLTFYYLDQHVLSLVKQGKITPNKGQKIVAVGGYFKQSE